MSVPVENIYYLLCYAWDQLHARSLVDVTDVPGNRAENLLGTVLDQGVGHLIRGGLDRGYVPILEDGRRFRGKLLAVATASRLLLQQGRVACESDDLSPDVPHNRALKAAMRALLAIPTLDKRLQHNLLQHLRRFHEVSDVELSAQLLRSVQLHRNVSRYAFLMDVCALIERSLIPDDTTGKREFRPFTASEQEMGRVFELFVRRFMAREQSWFTVSAPHIDWDVDAAASSSLVWLPTMRTDTLLTSPQLRVVIETKYYATAWQQRVSGTRKLRSAHLYQLLAYVDHLARMPGPEPMGLLLYAGTELAEPLHYRIDGRTIMIRSLNLNQPWQQIHGDLVGLAGDLAEAVSTVHP